MKERRIPPRPKPMFSRSEVLQIRKDYVFAALSLRKLAAKYGCNQSTIVKVLKKRSPYES